MKRSISFDSAVLWRSLSIICLAAILLSNLHHGQNIHESETAIPESKMQIEKRDLSQQSLNPFHPLAQPGRSAQPRPQVNTDKIKAYVISMNSTGRRFLRTKNILEECGLHVIHVQPISLQDSFLDWYYPKHQNPRVYSNKYTFRMIWDWITSDPTLDSMEVPFSLIFEDDIQLNSQVRHHQVPGLAKHAALIAHTHPYSGLFYMGFGLGYKWPLCDDSGVFAEVFDGIGFNRCNGRLFHATGLLKYEGKWLNDRVEMMNSGIIKKNDGGYPYMDAVVQDGFSKEHWYNTPLAIGYDLADERTQKGVMHRGIFFQDRDEFGSEIK